MAQQFYSPLQLNSTLTVGVDDTGNDVIFYGATSGRYLQWDESDDSLLLKDNVTLKIGNGQDLRLNHNATDSFVTNYNGDLYITNQADDKDVIFRCDDGSGGNTAYLTLDGSIAKTTVSRPLKFDDNISAEYGTDTDMIMYSSGSHGYIENYTGDLKLINNADNSRIRFQADNGAGGIATYFDLSGSMATHDGSATTSLWTQWYDNSRISFGNGHDTQIYHDGTNTNFYHQTGDLYFKQGLTDGDIIFQADDGSGGLATYITIDGSNSRVLVGKDLNIEDSMSLQLGNSQDLKLYHHSNHSYIEQAGTGDLYIQQSVDDGDIIFMCDDGSGGVEEYFRLDGGNTQVKFSKNTNYVDTINASFGTGGDLKISHSGTHSSIENETGNLYIINDANDGDIVFQSDDGSGGVETYFFLDGSSSRTIFPDAKYLVFGTDQNLFITHTGSDSYIQNYTSGSFYIDQQVDDQDIIFRCDDGSGGVENYIQIDGSEGRTLFNKHLRVNDSVELQVGAAADLRIYHNGTDSYINNATGNLQIKNSTDDGDIEFVCDDGSGGNTAYLTLDGGLGFTTVQKAMRFNDGVGVQFGTGSDFSVSHNGTDSNIANYTGNLNITANSGNMNITNNNDDSDIIFSSDDGSGGVKSYFYLDGSIGATIVPDSTSLGFGTGGDMYISHDATNTHVTNFTGDLYITNKADDKDVILRSDDGSGGITAYITLDGSAGYTTVQKNMQFADGVYANFGASSDIEIAHVNDQSYIINNTGNLEIRQNTNDGDIIFSSDDGSGGTSTYFTVDGSATRVYFERNIRMVDSGEIQIGTGGDLKLYHDGSNSHIADSGTGDLYITASDNMYFQTYASGKRWISLTENAGVDLYHNDSLILATSSTGVAVTGDVTVSDDLFIADGGIINVGTGNDLNIQHDASDSIINNNTGHLYITNFADDRDIYFRSDDGSGGVTEYFRLDGSSVENVFSKDLRIIDSEKLMIGSGQDTYIYHNGSNTYVDNYTGDLYFRQEAADKDIIFQCDDGSGSLETYFFLDGSNNFSQSLKHIRFADNASVLVGSSSDLSITHDGTNSVIANSTGDLQINQNANDKDIIFSSDDGSGGTAEYFRLDGSQSGASSDYRYTRWQDYSVIALGNGNDLQLWHDASNGKISNYTGDLHITQELDNKDIIFNCDDGSGGTTAYITLDGSQEAVVFGKAPHIPQYINHVGDGDTAFGFADNDVFRIITGGTTRLNIGGGIELTGNTTSQGNIQVNGTLTVGADDTGHDVKFFGATSGSYMLWDESADSLNMVNSNAKITGTSPVFEVEGVNGASIIIDSDSDNSGAAGSYLRFYDSGSHIWSWYKETNNDMYLYNPGQSKYPIHFANEGDAWLMEDGGDLGIGNTGNPAAKLHVAGTFQVGVDDTGHDVKFFGATSGKYMLWDESGDRLILADNTYLALGTGSDILAYHTGSAGHIQNYTGNFTITNNTDDGDIIFQSDDGSGGGATYFRLDGSEVETRFHKSTLHYDNIRAKYGDSGDLQIQHDGSNSYISNGVGDLYIQQNANDKDLVLQCDDGSGGTTAYLTLDGGVVNTYVHKDMRFVDGVNALFGTGGDVGLKHDGSNMTFINSTGSMAFYQNTDDGDMVFYCDDGSGGLTAYLTLDGSAGVLRMTKDMYIPEYVYHEGDDNTKFGFSADDTFKVFTGGSERLVVNSSGMTTGQNITASNIIVDDDGQIGSASATSAMEIADDGVVSFNGGISAAGNVKSTIKTRIGAVTSSTDGDYKMGDVVYFGGTTSMTTGAIYHYKSDGTWELADADAASTCDGLLGIALGAASNTNGVLLRGFVTLDHDPGAVGDVLYVSTTAGDTTATAPSGSGDIVRVIGYCLHASSGMIYFNPDGTFVEVA